ncbi:variant erythrocyte surface antigen-1 family protein [Babesia caballi]|uniref:Variant erythrocyte surface antigen-1 family protein n=1 Tax=Babesia caballi TaxID=5871 RepID=A0AAV4LPL9_BABCB|nr:variant erythrocyte surface antigen-1 family protein [Babesia caballi]
MGADELLKKPPDNLKDAIDWIVWFSGYGGNGSGMNKYEKLAEALKNNQEFQDAKNQAFGNTVPAGVINMLAKGLGPGLLGYVSDTTFDHNKGIVKRDNGYTSAYNTAQWENGRENDYAKVFLGAAVMAFYGVTYLYWKCTLQHDSWATDWLNVSGQGLGYFMLQMGYQPSTELQNINGSKVAESLIRDPDGFSELKSAKHHHYTYSGFLNKFEEQNASNNALNSPLTACYKFAKHYFKSQFKDTEPSDDTLLKIKKAFESFQSSCSNHYYDLKSEIDGFLKEAMPDPASSQSADTSDTAYPSPAGTVACTLTTLGLGSGATAAYIFNIGGAKTLVNGLLRIG